MSISILLQALNGFLMILTCDGEVFFATHSIESYLGFHQVSETINLTFDNISMSLNTELSSNKMFTLIWFEVWNYIRKRYYQLFLSSVSAYFCNLSKSVFRFFISAYDFFFLCLNLRAGTLFYTIKQQDCLSCKARWWRTMTQTPKQRA